MSGKLCKVGEGEEEDVEESVGVDRDVRRKGG